MNDRINPVQAQPGPVAFIGICVYGVFVGLRQLVIVPAGTEPWWVGVILLLMVISGFAFIIGGWLSIQREVDFMPDKIVVRRWLEILTGRPGRTIPIDAAIRASIIPQNIRSLRLEHPEEPPLTMTLGYWDRRRVRQLVDALHARGIPLDQYWEGAYPPGTD